MVAVEDFFLGPGKNALKDDEVLTEIQIPTSPDNTRGTYLKLSRTAADLALVGVAVFVVLDSKQLNIVAAKIVMGATGPTPIRALKAEGLIKGKAIKEFVIEEVAKTAAEEALPISDVRASADYRRDMIMVMTKQAIAQVFAGT